MFVYLLYAAIAVGMFFVADAAIGLVRSSRGADDDAVKRRLARDITHPGAGASQFRILRSATGEAPNDLRHVPFIGLLSRLIFQSGVDLPPDRALMVMAILTLIAFGGLAYVLPLRFLPYGFPIALFVGIGLVVAFLFHARSSRLAKFEEQLPDALDLIVRSLKIGHPLSSAIAVIAKEMPAPIGLEFAIAFDEVTYGSDVQSAIKGMVQRVPALDLKYISMAVQIQQESGGNLVESLAKLSAVIRDRFRMFRKVKAVTAEGRFSAWLLSIFPFAIAFVLQLIRPDYYTQIADYPFFPHIVIAVIVMLLINIIAMRVLTTIKV